MDWTREYENLRRFFTTVPKENTFEHWNENQNAMAADNRRRILESMPQAVQPYLQNFYLPNIPDTGFTNALSEGFNKDREYYLHQMPIDSERNRARIKSWLMGINNSGG